MPNSAPGDSFLGAFSLRPPSHRGLRRVLPVDSGVRRFAIDSPLEGDGFEPSVPPVGDAIFWDPPEPGDDKLARLPEPDSDDRQGRVYRAPSQAGPGNDINAGSPGFQKAPTRGPASLVAGPQFIKIFDALDNIVPVLKIKSVLSRHSEPVYLLQMLSPQTETGIDTLVVSARSRPLHSGTKLPAGLTGVEDGKR